MVSTGELRIIRYTVADSAATGEGERYETHDGRIWHRTQPFEYADGTIMGNKIIPKLRLGG